MNWIKSIIKTIIKEQFVLLLCLFVYSSNGFSQSNNPIISLADVTTTCFDDNSEMPKFFLCGSSDTRLITTDFPGATVSWYKFNEGSCSTITDDCSNSNSPCTWTLVATSPNFTVSAGGHFKVVITNSDTTQTTYYFNVYQNGLDIPVTQTDIYCGHPGEIRVAQLTGYEYSLDGVAYQLSNTFSIATAGDYTVKVRRVGATTDCVFDIPVTILKKELDVVATVTQPINYGDKGTIQLTTTNVREQYFYKITQGSTFINEVGPIPDTEYPFSNLNAGTYTWSVKTDDCDWKSGQVTINTVSPFQITTTVQPVTCQPGSIKVVVTGGTAPYQYFINGNATPTSSLISVPVAGDYTVEVIDNNGLTDQIRVTVPLQSAPVYTIEKSNLNCYYPNSWQIKFNVSNYNGNAVKFSINNGITFSDNPIFNGLSATPAGTTFKTIIEYSYGGVKCTQTEDVTIFQPQYGLSATAGVSELIGCLSTDLDKAKIRVTNPQGGTSPYQYSYDNQATWTNATSIFKPAGKYVFYIKDLNGCVSAMQEVTVENIGVPVVTVTNQSFNCDGTANSVINSTTTTNTVFSYTYSLDGNPFQSTPNFSNVEPGQHSVEVKYEPLIVPTYSNLLKEDFGYGADTTSPGMNATYCFERQVAPITCNASKGWGLNINDGEYAVTSSIIYPFGSWYVPKDHTNPLISKGRFLVVNIRGDNSQPIIYEKVINEIIPYQLINVEFYVTNLLKIGTTPTNPNLRVAIVNVAGVEIDSYQTGSIPKTETWKKYSTQLNPGNNNTLRFQVRSIEKNENGNDVAIDDITAYQLPRLCASTRKINFTVPTGKAFDASITNTKNVSCAGLSNGEITIAAQNFNTTTGYQVSKDNGSTWQTAMTSPYTISGLGNGIYTVKVRYNATATGVCVKSFSPITITVPTQLTTTADVTTLASCTRGATITADSNEGTPFYQYELWNESNTTIVRSVQKSEIFDNVPSGIYTIRGLDANGCGNTTPVSITVLPPPIPDPSRDSSSDLCYDEINQATIKINVDSGTAPFSYSLNGGASQNSNTFLNVGPGTHIVEVTDVNNCKATTTDIKIGNELKTAAVLTKALDCTTSPDAKIKVTFEGGVRPLLYQVKKAGIIISTTDIPIPDTDTSFFYTVTEGDAETYSFTIIDAHECFKTTNAVVVNPKENPEISTLTEIQSILCHGDKTAAIQVNLDTSKGVGPFMYSINGSTNQSNAIFSNLTAGTYDFKVTDANGCQSIKEQISIDEPAKIIVTSHALPITCDLNNGQSKGSVIVDGVSGGVASYNYFVTGVNGYNEKEINTEGDTSYTFDVVDFGLYQINVVDTNGCSVLIQDVLVASPPTDLEINVSTPTINCSSGGTAIVKITDNSTFSSEGPFYFAIYTPGLVYNSSNPAWVLGDVAKSTTFTGLIPGVKYTFIVFDDTTKCYHYKTAEAAIPTKSTLEVDYLEAKNITCKGEANGKVSFTVTNNYSVDTPISYQVYNSQSLVPVNLAFGTFTLPSNSSTTIFNLGDLPFGNYFVLIKEDVGATNEGCSIASNTFNITESTIDLSLLPKVIKNANCNEKGIINVLAKDGTAPYQYQIVTDSSSIVPSAIASVPPPPSLIPGNWVNDNTFSVDGGNYIVSVKDAYGCVKSMTISLPKDPEPVFIISVPNPCVNEGNFKINISESTAGIAPYYLSVNGSVFAPITLPFNLLNQNSGNYIIAVKDVNGCTNPQPPLLIDSPLGLSSIIVKQPTCAFNDGEVQAIGVGGSGSFEYKIDSRSYGSVFNFTELSSGNHTITINDTTTGCEKEITVNLEDPTPVTGLTLSQKAVSCHGESDGSITATFDIPAAGINDNPVYTFSLNDGTPQDSNIFTGLAATSYTVKVISGRACIATATISVTEPDGISVPAPSVNQFGCNSTNNLNNASITVSGVITGGSGNYTQYEFIKNGITLQFGSNSTYIETDLNGGSYTINVFDDKGCKGTQTTSITPFVIMDDINVSVITAISCDANETIEVSVLGIGGTPSNIEYSLIPVSGSLVGTSFPLNTSGIFSGLTVGEYLISARNTVTNCTIQEVYTVNEPNTFDITIDSVVDVSCFGGANGSANITLIDRNTPSKAGAFDYTIKDSSGNSVGTTAISTNAGPIAISNLKADVYSITAKLTNTPFCSVTKNFTISQPTATLNVNTTLSEITCAIGNTDGRITALPTGGWSDFYEFKWEKAGTVIENWGDVSELTNLKQGTYKVYVRDAKDCEVENLVTLSNPNPITFTAATDNTQLQCFADRTATISTRSVSGGQGSNYWYTLNKTSPNPLILGPQIDTEFEKLGAGTYTVTVTDNWSCTTTSPPITIDEPNNVVATLSLLTPPTCKDPAQLDLQITGGNHPFSYSSNNLDFTPTLSNPLNGNPGVNRYFIKDNNGCGSYISNDVVVATPARLTVSVDTTFAKVNCFGESTAAILATAQGGLGNYFYTLLDEGNTIIRTSQPTGIFAGLPAGKYKVKVTSADCDPVESSIITITEPAAKLNPTYSLKNAVCAGSNDGSIKITSLGGTVTIKHAISPNLSQFTESDLFQNLAAGDYDLLVQDAVGCYDKTTLKITEPSVLSVTTIASSIVQEVCFNDKNAQFSIVATGGTLPYSVSLDNPSGPFTTGTAIQSQFDFTNLIGGIHTVYIKDANNCTLDWTVDLNESVKLNPTTNVNYDCVSNTQHNLVTVSIDPSITDFTFVQFAIDGGVYQSSNVFSNLTAGDHYIRVKHNNGCIKDSPIFTIKKVDPLILSVKDGGLNEIIAVPNGGGGNYKFTFDGEFNDTNPSYIYYKTKDYLVTVHDANGCNISVTQKFNYIDICIPNYFTPNGDTINDTWAPGCTINYKNLTFSVLDRYGRELGNYHLGESWDGKYQGVELPSGDYWFVLQLNNSKDDREFVGHFTLYR